MDIFTIPKANCAQDLLDSLALVGAKVGVQMKVGLDISDKALENNESQVEKKYVKIDCAFPLRACPFYLLYQIHNDTSLIFACNLNHSHEMGPIPIDAITSAHE